jgi:hypothetical protein
MPSSSSSSPALWQSLEKHRTSLLTWLRSQQLTPATQQAIAALSMLGQVVIQQPVEAQVISQLDASASAEERPLLDELSAEEHQAIIEKLQSYTRRPPGHLERQDELYVEQQLSEMLGFEVTAELEGNRLNHSIGIMGGEQHLKRFPTDTLDQHDAFRESGIAPNRGAFGWFTENGQLTEKAIQREKYYFAVQTLYLPNWNAEHPRLKKWYAYRKMVAINPFDQIAVVGVVGDAGPALRVNKQYGGSPEVIREAKIWSKAARGHVMLFFVDDPQDTIPLGVIQLKSEGKPV